MSKHGVEPTRWWWVRHAPVPNPGGVIYAQQDWDCDVSDTEKFEALRRMLPEGALWLTSHLKRTAQTAEAILAHGGEQPVLQALPEFAEQHFGDWQGRTWADLHGDGRPGDSTFWEDPATNRPPGPGGESFADLVERVSAAVMRLTGEYEGRDIVAVTHGGTIRAAVALALDLTPAKGLAVKVDNLSLTRLEHFRGGSLKGRGAAWRVAAVNLPPRVA